MDDDIVLFQILPRLPARSIGRFMSVCKQWHEFLTTPEFAKMHLHHLNSQNCQKLLAVPVKNAWNYFRIFDCETPEVGLSAHRPFPFEVGSKKMSILSSLNGLVCVGIGYSDIILWNPLTGDYKALSKDNFQGNRFNIDACTKGYGLYYSSCDDDYELLHVTQSNDAYIYSLKSDSWRKAKSRVHSILTKWHSSCLLNGKLYFVAQKGIQSISGEWSSLIISFDTKTEMFTEIATPSSYAACFNLMVVGGCVHLCVVSKIENDNLELWKMDGDGEWTKVIRYSMSPVVFQPCHLMKNGNWMFLSGHRVDVYKVSGKDVKRVSKYATDSNMVLLIKGKFVETMVSLKPK